MTHQIPAYATAELLRLEREIAELEQVIARKNEQRREIIDRCCKGMTYTVAPYAEIMTQQADKSAGIKPKRRGGGV